MTSYSIGVRDEVDISGPVEGSVVVRHLHSPYGVRPMTVLTGSWQGWDGSIAECSAVSFDDHNPDSGICHSSAAAPPRNQDGPMLSSSFRHLGTRTADSRPGSYGGCLGHNAPTPLAPLPSTHTFFQSFVRHVATFPHGWLIQTREGEGTLGPDPICSTWPACCTRDGGERPLPHPAPVRPSSLARVPICAGI